MCVVDDIIVYGTDDDIQHATEDHDKKLRELLLRCRKKGIRLNRNKCQFRTNDITFLGHRITSQGLKPHDANVEAIMKMENPYNVEEARLQGTVNYLARFNYLKSWNLSEALPEATLSGSGLSYKITP